MTTTPRRIRARAALGRAAIVIACALSVACAGVPTWDDAWWTPDQQGRRAFEDGDLATAAARFEDPLWRGTALYLDQRFESALAEFARVDTPEGWFGRGNALAHLERYEEALDAYARALELRPGYEDAAANLEYIQVFQPLSFEGGETGVTGRDAAADQVVFDADAERLDQQGIDTRLDEGGETLSSDQMADLWLRQADASPASFLRRKFVIQVASGGDAP
jgi:Ca-activated chloride channel family protein